MSLVFSDTSTFKGLVQIYEKEIGASQGDVSGSTTRLKAFAADANLALDDVWSIGIRASGYFQLDDTNQSDYPERFMTLTSGTRRYALSSLTADAGSNLLLEIYKVFIKDPSGVYIELSPVDVQSSDDVTSFTDGQDVQGTPYRYDKTGNYIDLDPVPNYTQSTTGIKVLINREPSYFAYTDTTKKAGIPGNLHRYLAIKPAYDYARAHNLQNWKLLQFEVEKMERIIGETFGQRDHDTPKRITVATHDTR